MTFADLIPQEAKELGNMGSQGLLAVAALVFAGVVVYLFRRSERKDEQAATAARAAQERHEGRMGEIQQKHEAATAAFLEKHDDAVREHRTEFTSALAKVTDGLRAVAEESRTNAAECRINIAALREDLKRDRP